MRTMRNLVYIREYIGDLGAQDLTDLKIRISQMEEDRKTDKDNFVLKKGSRVPQRKSPSCSMLREPPWSGFSWILQSPPGVYCNTQRSPGHPKKRCPDYDDDQPEDTIETPPSKRRCGVCASPYIYDLIQLTKGVCSSEGWVPGIHSYEQSSSPVRGPSRPTGEV